MRFPPAQPLVGDLSLAKMVMDGRDKTLWVLNLSSVLRAAPAGLWLGAGGAGEHAMGVCGV